MKEVGWEKKKKDWKIKKIVDKHRGHLSKVPLIDKKMTIGFNADQFIIRFPKEFSDFIQLNPKDAQNNKYIFNITLDTSKYKPEDKHFKGTFEVIKND